MVLSNSKSMHTRIQNSEISIQGLQVQYSTFYSNRSNSINSINSTIRNRLLLQLFVSEMIHAKQWHYSLQRLPVASFYTHSTRRNPRDSSSTNSTPRRQGALRFILHTEGKEIFYPVYKILQGHSRHYYTFQHLPVQTSTFQCHPVYPGIPYIPAFL